VADAGQTPSGDHTAPATYAAAGVDIAAGEDAVERIKPLVASTHRPGVLGGIGGFGGMFAVPVDRYRQPVLVSATDGVGTKAMVAGATGRLDTIGIDLVAMCVDDLVCQGAEPLFFLDYVSVGRLDPDRMVDLVAGVAEGCRQAGCALVGGEMAEHPGAMDTEDFDLVGFAVGVVERDAIITGDRVAPGDVLVGLPSPNLRSNGFSLARHVLLERAGLPLGGPAWPGADHDLATELLEPSVIYAPAVLALRDAVDVRAVAHITGGGLPGNLVRVLPDGMAAEVVTAAWSPPRIFSEIQRLGQVADDEMFRTFNMGIGMVAVVPASDAEAAVASLVANGHEAVVVGTIVAGDGTVTLA
jgi:phosphoribosylformylglycinamidine cyclo-ligase